MLYARKEEPPSRSTLPMTDIRPALQQPPLTAETKDRPSKDASLLREEDFANLGQSDRKPNPLEDTFHVLIHKAIPAYTFHVISFNTATNTQGRIEISRDGDLSTKPRQVIPLDPNMRFYDMIPVFFNVQDVNFDGFADIGVPHEGGAKWSSYTYWIFNQKTGNFITTPLSKDLANIGFNFISFDKQKKQLTTDNLAGVGSLRSLYQFRNGRIQELKSERLENIVQHDAKESTDTPTLFCEITTTDYALRKPRVTRRVVPYECARSMHTIPFVYPEEFKARFL